MKLGTKVNWIPTEVAIPKKDGKYLVQTDCGNITTLEYWNGFFNAYPGSNLENVIGCVAWAPLPKPYKTKGVK